MYYSALDGFEQSFYFYYSTSTECDAEIQLRNRRCRFVRPTRVNFRERVRYYPLFIFNQNGTLVKGQLYSFGNVNHRRSLNPLKSLSFVSWRRCLYKRNILRLICESEDMIVSIITSHGLQKHVDFDSARHMFSFMNKLKHCSSYSVLVNTPRAKEVTWQINRRLQSFCFCIFERQVFQPIRNLVYIQLTKYALNVTLLVEFNVRSYIPQQSNNVVTK